MECMCRYILMCDVMLCSLFRVVHYGYKEFTRGRDRQYLRILEFQSFQLLAKVTREVRSDDLDQDDDESYQYIRNSGPEQVCVTPADIMPQSQSCSSQACEHLQDADHKTSHQIVAFLKETLKCNEEVQEKVSKLMIGKPEYFAEMLTIGDMHQR